MSSQQTCKYNLLSATSRRFYKRKSPTHEIVTNEPRISKVMKTLNSSYTMRKINKYQFLKTEANDQRFSEDSGFNQTEFIKKQLKTKIQFLLRKTDKKWKLLLESYEDMKACTNKQALVIQENKFYSVFSELLRKSLQEEKINTNKGKIFLRTSQNQESQKVTNSLLQKIRLQKENEILRKKCLNTQFSNFQSKLNGFNPLERASSQNSDLYKNCNNTDEINMKLRRQIKQLNQKIFDMQNQNMKLKENLVITQDSLNVIKSDRTEQVKKVAQLKNQNQNMCAQFLRVNLQNQNSKIKVQRWRSTIAFQMQEIVSYESELVSIKNQYKDLMRRYKLLVRRLNNMNTNSNTLNPSNGFSGLINSQKFSAKYYDIFKDQLDTFTKVRNIFSSKDSECHLDKSVASNEKKMSNTITDGTFKNYLTEKQSLSNVSGVKRLPREHYAYFKPNFYNLVEGYMDLHGIDSSTIGPFGGGFDLNCQFLTTLRAILDSKFNQFLFQDFTKITNFGNFTYVWLTKFKIHRKKKSIIQIKGDPDKQIIPTFFLNLMSEKLNCNWQIITFRQFLMDSLTLDELYFYLMARNYMFRGNLLDNINGLYQQIYYVNISEALILMQKFIPDINYRKKIEEYIKRFIIYIRKRAVIDAHFILRILLEFYQSKKHQQFVNLNSLAELLSKQKQAFFTFESFLKIFQYNFLYLSLTDKLQIYSKCFSSSRGKINLEVILTVLTQDGYLCKEVRQVFLNDPINLVKLQKQNNEGDDIIQPTLTELVQFENFFTKFSKQTQQLEIPNLGMQDLKNRIQVVKDFSQTNIFSRIELVFTFCLSTLRKMYYTKKISLQGFLPIFKETVQMLKKMDKVTCEKKQIMDLMIGFKRDAAAKKILKFYRKKRNQMHRNFIFGVKDETLEEEQKMENIRKQFNNMIENMKDKFAPE